MDLFSAGMNRHAPLADRMRPRTLDEFAGQQHIVGKGKLLRRAIETDSLQSSIFFGPPGCGKTTLASIVANTTGSDFVKLNAVTSGVKDVRQVLARAHEPARRTISGFTAGKRIFCWMNATAGARRRATAYCPPWSAG